MPKHFASTAHRWKQRGDIYLWRYLDNARNYPSLNLSVDPLAHESLLALFRAFVQERLNCKRTLTITTPTPRVLRVPNNRGGAARISSPTSVRLSYDSDLDAVWTMDEAADPLAWQLGAQGSAEVLSVLEEPDRHFDSSFGGDPVIWWWGVI
jgi:hypothetical protein